MSHLFHMVSLMDNHPYFTDKESYHYNICPSSASIHPSLYPQDGHCLVWAKQSATYRRLRTQCSFSCATDISGIYPLFMRKPDSFNRYFWSTSNVLANFQSNTAKAKKKKKKEKRKETIFSRIGLIIALFSIPYVKWNPGGIRYNTGKYITRGESALLVWW